MTRPTRHPQTGIYRLRRRVPKDLQAILGKTEEKRSLGTKDPEEAKIRFVQALTEIDARWASLRRGQRTLSEQDAHALAKQVYADWLAKHAANPSQPTTWDLHLGDVVADRLGKEQPAEHPFAAGFVPMEELCRRRAQDLLDREGTTVDGGSLRKLLVAVARALHQATLVLRDHAKNLTFTHPFNWSRQAAAPPECRIQQPRRSANFETSAVQDDA